MIDHKAAEIANQIANGESPNIESPELLERVKVVLRRRWLHTYEARAWWRANVSPDIPVDASTVLE